MYRLGSCQCCTLKIEISHCNECGFFGHLLEVYKKIFLTSLITSQNKAVRFYFFSYPAATTVCGPKNDMSDQKRTCNFWVRICTCLFRKWIILYLSYMIGVISIDPYQSYSYINQSFVEITIQLRMFNIKSKIRYWRIQSLKDHFFKIHVEKSNNTQISRILPYFLQLLGRPDFY